MTLSTSIIPSTNPSLPTECDQLDMDRNKKRADDEYRNRYGCLSDGRASDDEKISGKRRIDVLMDNTRLGGLTRNSNLHVKEEWVMKVMKKKSLRLEHQCVSIRFSA